MAFLENDFRSFYGLKHLKAKLHSKACVPLRISSQHSKMADTARAVRRPTQQVMHMRHRQRAMRRRGQTKQRSNALPSAWRFGKAQWITGVDAQNHLLSDIPPLRAFSGRLGQYMRPPYPLAKTPANPIRLAVISICSCGRPTRLWAPESRRASDLPRAGASCRGFRQGGGWRSPRP